MEHRVLLAGDTLAWHNVDMPEDVNGDRSLTSFDALLVINDLNRAGPRPVDDVAPAGMVDVTNDGFVSSRDALRVINALNAGEGEQHERVRIRLAVTPVDSTEPISLLGPNEDFMLRGYVQDLTERTGISGVFAAYLDVNYDTSLVQIPQDGSIEFSPPYTTSRSGSLTTAGLIDEVGAADGLDPLGLEERLLFSVPMSTGDNLGIANFSGDAADMFPAHDTLMYDVDDPIPPTDIEYAGTTLQIVVGAAPVANADFYNGVEDQTVIVIPNGVLSNDSDEDGDDLTAVLVAGPSHGTLDLRANGSFTYRGAEHFNGTDSFTYAANDGANNSAPATVTLQIAAVNDAPVVANESYATGINAPLNVSAEDGVLKNDFDIEGSQITAVETRSTSNGTLTLNDNGSFSYVPANDFSGEDSFDYVVSDGERSSVIATATIMVTANQAPVAVADNYTVDQDSPATFPAAEGVLSNDRDAEGDTLTAQLVGDAAQGSLDLRDDGSFSYEPNAGFHGEDTFTYRAFDGSSTSDSVTVTINVRPVAQAPVAADDTYTMNEDQPLSIPAPGVLDNDTDADGQDLTATPVTQPTNGLLTLRPDGSFDYTPFLENFNGTDQFTYTASDGELTSDPATVTINVTPVNDAPIAVDDGYRVIIDTKLEVDVQDGLLSNDTDVDNNADDLTVQVVQDVAAGLLDVATNGSFAYTPASGFSGEVTFTYNVSDGALTSDPATVTLSVGAGGADVAFRLATTDSAGNILTEITTGGLFELRVFVQDVGAPPNSGVFAAFTDVTFDAALAATTGAIVHAGPYTNGRSGDVSTAGLIDEAGGFDGLDPLGESERLVFSVPMRATAAGDLTLTADPADETPAHFILTFDRSAPIPTDQIDYGQATLKILDRMGPTAMNDEYLTSRRLEVSNDEGVLANDSQGDGGAISASLVQDVQNGELQLNADGSFTYTPNAGFVGDDVFTYAAVSESASSAPATVTITVIELGPSSVSGSVYFDVNNNGRRDAVEQSLGGVVIRLAGTDFLGDTVELTTRTTRDGRYSFDDLLAGNYVISQDQPAIVIDGIDALRGTQSSSNDAFAVDLEQGTDASGFNFGERGLRPEYFGNLNFLSSVSPDGVSAAIGPDGSQSWYHLKSGWDSFRAVDLVLADDLASLRIVAVDLNGNFFGGTVSILGNSDVELLGNAVDGYLVELRGPSNDYPLEPVATNSLAAVDAVFAGL